MFERTFAERSLTPFAPIRRKMTQFMNINAENAREAERRFQLAFECPPVSALRKQLQQRCFYGWVFERYQEHRTPQKL
jgi:hypothetical protein